MCSKNKEVLDGLYNTFRSIMSGEDINPNRVDIITKTADSIYRQRMVAVREREVAIKEKEFKNI